jgi:hypothetical protein
LHQNIPKNSIFYNKKKTTNNWSLNPPQQQILSINNPKTDAKPASNKNEDNPTIFAHLAQPMPVGDTKETTKSRR